MFRTRCLIRSIPTPAAAAFCSLTLGGLSLYPQIIVVLYPRAIMPSAVRRVFSAEPPRSSLVIM
jgi:hypothetical protein